MLLRNSKRTVASRKPGGENGRYFATRVFGFGEAHLEIWAVPVPEPEGGAMLMVGLLAGVLQIMVSVSIVAGYIRVNVIQRKEGLGLDNRRGLGRQAVGLHPGFHSCSQAGL